MKLRIPATPEEAKYATVNEIEFKHDGSDVEPFWDCVNGCAAFMDTKTLTKMGAKFERDLPEVGDGKEYEYKQLPEGSPLPEGSWFWNGGVWALVQSHFQAFSDDAIYAIPKQPRTCVVEGKVVQSCGGLVVDVSKRLEKNDAVYVVPMGNIESINREGAVTVIVVREGE